jgi:putative membrane protein
MRVALAAERTLLAWVRTGLALMGFGFIVARFGLFLREMAVLRGVATPTPQSPQLSLWIGTGLIILGVMACLSSAVQHIRFQRRVRRGALYEMPTSVIGVALSGALAIAGLAMAVYLVGIG